MKKLYSRTISCITTLLLAVVAFAYSGNAWADSVTFKTYANNTATQGPVTVTADCADDSGIGINATYKNISVSVAAGYYITEVTMEGEGIDWLSTSNGTIVGSSSFRKITWAFGFVTKANFTSNCSFPWEIAEVKTLTVTYTDNNTPDTPDPGTDPEMFSYTVVIENAPAGAGVEVDGKTYGAGDEVLTENTLGTGDVKAVAVDGYTTNVTINGFLIVVTYTYNSTPDIDPDEPTEQPLDVTFDFKKGYVAKSHGITLEGGAYNYTTEALQINNGQTATFTAPFGYKITSVVLTRAEKNTGYGFYLLTPSTDSFEVDDYYEFLTWTGEEKSVSFTQGGYPGSHIGTAQLTLVAFNEQPVDPDPDQPGTDPTTTFTFSKSVALPESDFVFNGIRLYPPTGEEFCAVPNNVNITINGATVSTSAVNYGDQLVLRFADYSRAGNYHVVLPPNFVTTLTGLYNEEYVMDVTIVTSDKVNVNLYDETSGKFFGTYYSDRYWNVPAGCTAYYVDKFSGDAAHLTLLAEAGEGVESDLAVVLVSDAPQTAINVEYVSFVYNNVYGNYLRGTTESVLEGPYNGYTYLQFGKQNGAVGFYADSATADNGASANVTGHSAYLLLPVNPGTVNANGVAITFDDTLTGITSAATASDNAPVYNLSGQRVVSRQLPAGIYVKNGKKFIVK